MGYFLHLGIAVGPDTWRDDVKPQDIKECIDSAASGKLRVVSVSEVRISLLSSALLVIITSC